MRPRSLVVAALAIGGVAAVLLWPKGREVDVVAVARGPLAQSVVATGRIATPARIAIGSPLAATVLEVTVREGDVVKPGQLLARLRADDAAALVAQAAAAQAAARKAQEQAESDLATAQAALDACGRHCKTAIVMVLANLSAGEAKSLLAQNNGFIRKALSNT